MTQGTLGHSILVPKGTATMKNTKEFAENEYKARIRIKPETLELIKSQFRKLGYKSAAAFLDEIIIDYFKPNLFKRKK